MKKSHKSSHSFHTFTPLVALFGAILTLFLIATFHPGVKAEIQHVMDGASSLVRFNSAIPIRAPRNWPDNNAKTAASQIRTPVSLTDRVGKTSTSPATLPTATNNYYFESSATPDGYDINIYTVSKPSTFNQTSGVKVPLNDNQLVGSLSAHLRTNNDDFEPAGQFTSAQSVIESTRLPLGYGIIASNFGNVEVAWSQDGWHYSAQGEGAADYATKLVALLGGTTPINQSGSGDFRIINKKGVTIYIQWNLYQYQYEFVYRGDDMKQALDAARNATQWIIHNDVK